MQEEQEKKVKPPQTSLLLRVLGGGYLMYLAYDLLKQWPDLDVILRIGGIVFGIVGTALLVFSGKSLITNQYFYTPMMDEKTEEPPEAAEESEEEG